MNPYRVMVSCSAGGIHFTVSAENPAAAIAEARMRIAASADEPIERQGQALNGSGSEWVYANPSSVDYITVWDMVPKGEKGTPS